MLHPKCPLSFFFNDTATTEIYTLSLHDALPILALRLAFLVRWCRRRRPDVDRARLGGVDGIYVRVPPVLVRGDRRRTIARRLYEVDPARAVRRGLLHRVREIPLFRGHQVPKVG